MFALAATLQTLGPLKARVIDAQPNQTVERVVVLMHGFGAPGDDLVGLVSVLPMSKGTRYVFPEAPIDMGQGRAWWLIDWAERARYERSGELVKYMALVPPGLAEASAQVSAMLDHIEKEWKLGPEKIVLGGFSQGSMLALDVAAHRAKKPAALILMSSSLVATSCWLDKASSLKGLPVLLSHGKQDVVLPFFVAEQLRDVLGKAGAAVQWIPFTGGHAIPDAVITGLRQFL